MKESVHRYKKGSILSKFEGSEGGRHVILFWLRNSDVRLSLSVQNIKPQKQVQVELGKNFIASLNLLL